MPSRIPSKTNLEAWLDRVTYLLGLPVAGLLYLLGIRFLILSSQSVIGHLVAEMDYFLKKWRRGDYGRIRPVLPISLRLRVNRRLLEEYQRAMTVVTNRGLISAVKAFERYPFLGIDLSAVVTQAQDCPYYRFRAETPDLPPSLTISDADRAQAWTALERLGVPRDRWLVAVHARDDDPYQGLGAARNANIESYEPAIAAIYNRGGWCLRMGKPRLPEIAKIPGLTDYGNSTESTDALDVQICGMARFFLGCSSGLVFVAMAHGIPCISANMVPFGALLLPAPGDLSLPKRMRLGGRDLTFAEMAAHPLANDLQLQTLAKHDVAIIDTQAQDIRDAVLQMMDHLDGCEASETPDDRALQTAMHSLLGPQHYCFGGAGHVARGYLQRHRQLLSLNGNEAPGGTPSPGTRHADQRIVSNASGT